MNERKVIKYIHKLLEAGILEAAGPDKVKFSDEFLDLLERVISGIYSDRSLMEVVAEGGRTVDEVRDNLMAVSIASALAAVFDKLEETELMEMTSIIYHLLMMSGGKQDVLHAHA